MQIIPELGIGGAEQGCIDVASEIVKSGARSIVVSNGGSRVPDLLRIKSDHIDMPVHSKNPLRMWKNIRMLKKLFVTRASILFMCGHVHQHGAHIGHANKHGLRL